MPNNPTIRPVQPTDIPVIREIVDATLFPAAMLDEMIAPFFQQDDCTDIWLTLERDAQPVAVAFCEAERMTEGTWNVLAIGVLPALQGRGIGGRLLGALEVQLARRGQRLLIVETSGLPVYEQARRFYRSLGYAQEARIRDFYADGEDKVVFRKVLVARE